MLIINADDWGRSDFDTEAIRKCYTKKRITSVSAMVFMEDSERAADIAKEADMDVGLHLNFNEEFTGNICEKYIREDQNRTKKFLNANRYSVVLYNPFLIKPFRNLYQVQTEEFIRLYGRFPSHFDGHQHMHLCANALFDGLIPQGKRVRRSYSFWPGEKSFLNRTYRHIVDQWISSSYQTTDYFFDLSHILKNNLFERITNLAKTNVIELNTHPSRKIEIDYLLSNEYCNMLKGIETANYSII